MENDLLPLSKSWVIRMLFLDMIYGEKSGYQAIGYIQAQDKKYLSDDILAALDCAQNYIKGNHVYDVRNAGTVCRFLVYIMQGKKYELRLGEQLQRRIKKWPDNLNKLSVAELLKLGTSQYASAALLLGAEPTEKLHPKCLLAVEARKAYFENGGKWLSRYDEVIVGQLENFLYKKEIKSPIAEDYCYLRAFNLITHDEGQKQWPELANHESNRLKVMEEICVDFDRQIEAPDDHRVVMAVALRQTSLGLPVRVSNKECVAKSWPQFWVWLGRNA